MASSRQDLSVEGGAQKPPLTSETIFKYVNIFVTLILVFCIQGFLNFRDHCISKGIYVFSIDSFIWSLVGFIGIFVLILLPRSPNTHGSTSCPPKSSPSSIQNTRAKREPTSIGRS